MGLGVSCKRVQRIDTQSIKRVFCMSLTVFDCDLRNAVGLLPKRDIVWRVMIMVTHVIGS
jgi:hypothetical protein